MTIVSNFVWLTVFLITTLVTVLAYQRATRTVFFPIERLAPTLQDAGVVKVKVNAVTPELLALLEALEAKGVIVDRDMTWRQDSPLLGVLFAKGRTYALYPDGQAGRLGKSRDPLAP